MRKLEFLAFLVAAGVSMDTWAWGCGGGGGGGGGSDPVCLVEFDFTALDPEGVNDGGIGSDDPLIYSGQSADTTTTYKLHAYGFAIEKLGGAIIDNTSPYGDPHAVDITGLGVDTPGDEGSYEDYQAYMDNAGDFQDAILFDFQDELGNACLVSILDIELGVYGSFDADVQLFAYQGDLTPDELMNLSTADGTTGDNGFNNYNNWTSENGFNQVGPDGPQTGGWWDGDRSGGDTIDVEATGNTIAAQYWVMVTGGDAYDPTSDKYTDKFTVNQLNVNCVNCGTPPNPGGGPGLPAPSTVLLLSAGVLGLSYRFRKTHTG